MTLVKIDSGKPIVNGAAVSSVSPKAGTYSQKSLPDTQSYDAVSDLGLTEGGFSGGDDEVAVASADTHHAPAANTDAVVTFSAQPGIAHAITGIQWSYNDGPTGGQIDITIGGVEVFKQYVTAGGAGFYQFPNGLKGAAGSAMVITLAAGGAGVSGSLDIQGYRAE